MYKAFGIRVFVTVSGQAGRFSIIPLMTTIGSGLGLMGISVVFADCIMRNFSKKKDIFQKMKEVDMKEMYKTENGPGKSDESIDVRL